MKKPKISKADADRFGRYVAMLLTRAQMYKPGHPYVNQTADTLYQTAARLLETVSPLIFSFHREQCFVDEEVAAKTAEAKVGPLWCYSRIPMRYSGPTR